MTFWVLLASGRITRCKLDWQQRLTEKLALHP
jgi:hypothetical protein